jgi:hypothetical protein
MISSKLFYDGNHFTSKQTKYKFQVVKFFANVFFFQSYNVWIVSLALSGRISAHLIKEIVVL